VGVHHQIDPDFVYGIREIAEMWDNHGITYPDEKIMLIRIFMNAPVPVSAGSYNYRT